MPELLVHQVLPGVRAITTLRPGGLSAGIHGGLNLAGHVGDDPAAVRKNRDLLARLLPSRPVWLRQVHGNRAVVVGRRRPASPEADAVVTRARGVVCGVLTADCLPVVLASRGGAVGVAHAGWRGLAAGVLESALDAMGDPPSGTVARIGPHIARASYPVGPEVRDALVVDTEDEEAFTTHGKEGKFLCDLGMLARARLARAGVGKVAACDLDTFRMGRILYSARRDGARTGRMATLAWRV